MAHESIDDLYARWQKNPDAAATATLCEALRAGNRPDLVEIVGGYAGRQLDLGALLAAARMYVDAGRLDDAQAALLAAGRLAPHEGEVYRWLGEVLLRRGDVERAEKVLEKAVQFGSAAEAAPLLERARALVMTRRTSGATAPVARRVPGPAARNERPAAPDPSRRFAPAESDDEVATQIRHGNDVRAAMEAALAPLSSPLPAAGGAPSPLAVPTRVAPPPPAPARTAAFERAAGPGPASPPHAAGGRPSFAYPTDAPQGRRFLDALARPPAEVGGASIPEARDVLDALQIAGVYEPDVAAPPQAFFWAKPERVRSFFGMATLIALAVVLVGAGTGTYFYVTSRRAKQHVEAEQLLAKVDQDLRASDAELLEPSEKAISRAFELESRSPHAALTWLRERALKGLLEGGADVAFEDATQRAKTVGIEEKQVAFAYVASFLFQGDTAGAASMIAKWDSVAKEDPWFELLAGATFERAGDARAIERYDSAVKLDPELVLGQALLARAMAVDGDARRAADLAKEFRARHPERPEGAALVALAWTRDPNRGEPPAEVADVTDKADRLPVALRAVPHAARAVLALHRGAVDEAKPSLQKGLGLADTPGVAAWLGSIALVTGDEALARKAALTAVSFSAVYPPARVLAARVALLGARLDEALKAAEDLPPSSADVAIVTAAVSYERLDGERMARAFEAVTEDVRKEPAALALVRGQALLAGDPSGIAEGAVLGMASDEAPWSDVVAMDWALDTGDLALAKKIAEGWRGEPRAMRAVRLSRLARYEGQLEDADKYSQRALETGTVTVRTLTERVFTLVAMKRDEEALALFKTHPNVGGPLAKWLRAYAVAAHGKLDEARAIVSQEDPPPDLAPMPARVVAAAAYAMMKDTRRGGEYVRPIAKAGFMNPDVTFALERLGAGKAARRGR